MQDATALPLTSWNSFYVLIGSASAALTGLQFVVMALVADARKNSSTGEVEAFGTPTVVHFCAVLFVAAVISAPWHGLGGPALVLGAEGAAGVAYALIVRARVKKQTGYSAVAEDWMWHVHLPLVSYMILLAGSLFLIAFTEAALFTIAATTVLLLFVGIHNSWDTATYIATQRKPGNPDQYDDASS